MRSTTISTRYGDISVAGVMETFADGALRSCPACAECALDTPLGKLVPQFTTDDLRKKEVQPVVFHEDGTLKMLPLERRTEIPTPAGMLPAELVTFHPDGAVSRVFPLNGKLTGYWTQDDEADLARPVRLRTPVGEIFTRIIGVGFHESGALRSVTLWPGDTVTVPTPLGEFEVRVGLSFTPDGALESLEPAKPTPVPTPAGTITAYDPDAVGINGDVNSLVFGPDGAVRRVTTTMTRLLVLGPDGETAFTPQSRESLCGDSEREVVPMTVVFEPDAVEIGTDPDAAPVRLPRVGCEFTAEPYLPRLANPFAILRCSV